MMDEESMVQNRFQKRKWVEDDSGMEEKENVGMRRRGRNEEVTS